MNEFHNRTDELAMLERRWESGESQIFLLWGRRRVGKTELLLEFGRRSEPSTSRRPAAPEPTTWLTSPSG